MREHIHTKRSRVCPQYGPYVGLVKNINTALQTLGEEGAVQEVSHWWMVCSYVLVPHSQTHARRD